jgi:hypothetical protein
MGWLCQENNWIYGHVPKDLVNEADRIAAAEVGEGNMEVSGSEEKTMEVEI